MPSTAIPQTATSPTARAARIHELVSAASLASGWKRVNPEGAVSMKTTGFTGGSCREATRELERALGMSGRESLLPEFFVRNGNSERIQQGG